MNYGHLRSIFIGRRALTPAITANLCSEAYGIIFFLLGEASADCSDETKISSGVREKYERMLKLLPKGLKFCLYEGDEKDKGGPLGSPNPEKTIRNSFAM